MTNNECQKNQMAALLKAAGAEKLAKKTADRKSAPRLSKALRNAVLDELFNRKTAAVQE